MSDKIPTLYANDFSTVRTSPRTSLIMRRTGIGHGLTIENRTVVSMPFEVMGAVDPGIATEIVVGLTAEAASLPIPPTIWLLLIEWREHRDKFPDDAFRPKSLARFMMTSEAEAALAQRNANANASPR